MQAIENLRNYVANDLIEKAHNATDRIDIEQLISIAISCGLKHLESEIEAIWVVRQKELNAQLIEHFEHIRGL
jgi:hypothetical protein